ncbi:DUF6165 family protein [Candidatus Eisenbacteria bacterium]|uniref:DUF6165 family protein n=1 Tax=Eiseniibacteriota bacterium TaxID=2212470 RepID=A0ABV6YNQ9_UNCEI
MKIEVSVGEAVDRLSILEIKIEKVRDPVKLENIRAEYALLRDTMEKAGVSCEDAAFLDLKAVNQRLWDIEDKIRRKERDGEFDDEFIGLARSVYRENDRRFEIKTRINSETGSSLVEEKEYVDYDRPDR